MILSIPVANARYFFYRNVREMMILALITR
jgi:hypothetical protein